MDHLHMFSSQETDEGPNYLNSDGKKMERRPSSTRIRGRFTPSAPPSLSLFFFCFLSLRPGPHALLLTRTSGDVNQPPARQVCVELA